MIRTLGATWIAAAAIAAVAAGLAIFHLASATAEPIAIAAIAASIVAAVLALVAAPLALAPGEALRASLEQGASGWGTARRDLWGRLAREIARLAEPASPPPDPFLEMRRLAANLELTLRETGEEMGVARRAVAEAAQSIIEAARVSGRLAAAAESTEQRLASAAAAAAAASGALAPLPGYASVIEAASHRTVAAASAVTEALAELMARREPSPAEAALREALARGADQARRLEAVMPLLLEAISRLPSAAASGERLAALAESLGASAALLADGLARLDAASARVESAASSLVVPDFAALLEAEAARHAALREEVVAAAGLAVETAVTRLADVSEVIAIDAVWRAGDAAAAAVARVEACARSLAEAAATEHSEQEARLSSLAGGLAATSETLERRVAEAEGLIARLEAATATRSLPREAIEVAGEEPLSSVAARLLAELSETHEEGAAVLSDGADWSDDRLRTVAGAIAARALA